MWKTAHREIVLTIWSSHNVVVWVVNIYYINVCCNSPFYNIEIYNIEIYNIEIEQSGGFEILTN